MQILRGATIQVPRSAVTIEATVTIETTVARLLSTGTVAASTRAVSTISPSIGWVSR